MCGSSPGPSLSVSDDHLGSLKLFTSPSPEPTGFNLSLSTVLANIQLLQTSPALL